ncbi:MAG: helix-turn-helix domain-containing protein [Chloroflexi bacterium]|nr:MAG: helix-turn-helix domain-containing protein [Chloroflexota bacterium]
MRYDRFYGFFFLEGIKHSSFGIEEVNMDRCNKCNKLPLDKQAEIIYGGEVKAFLNASEAARIFQVDRATITRWIRKGVIKGARRPKHTRQWRIPFSSCEALLKQHESR